MEALPEDVALVLLRGVGAYLRATPAPELPANVRRYKGFRDAALARQRETILALLDDETQRGLILQWLEEEKAPLDRPVKEVLRIACERPDGWEDQLRARSKTKETTGPSEDSEKLSSAVQRERDKAKRAKEELRELREASEAGLRAEKARAEQAAQEIGRLRSELEEARRETLRAQEEADKQRERADREVRRARSDAEKAQAKADEQVEQVRALRKEVESLQAELAKAAAASAKPKGRKSAAPRPPEGPRVPLPVPKGRFDDDAETLEEWLSTENVILVVDGYNVTKAEGGFGELELAKQRDLLIQGVDRLARRKGFTGTIVFDGNEVAPGTGRVARGPVKTVYSRPEEIADDHIVALIENLPAFPVVLATNDRELQGRARSLGATIATSNQLLKLVH